MTVISNAGPLMALAKIGGMPLLAAVYPGCQVPEAVYDEVVAAGLAAKMPDALAVDAAVKAGNLVILQLADSELPSDIQCLPLDRGERQVIHLARERHAGLVLLDDSRPRSIAESLGLKVKGTLGVIVEAFRAGVADRADVERLVASIKSRPDIWIADAVCDAVLTAIVPE